MKAIPDQNRRWRRVRLTWFGSVKRKSLTQLMRNDVGLPPLAGVIGELLLPSDGMRADERVDPALLNPASQYLASLPSSESRRVMRSRLRGVARALQASGIAELDWPRMDQDWLYATREVLTRRGLSPKHINAVFSLLKGIALHAWRLKIISADAYLRIKSTRAMPDNWQPKRRVLRGEEVLGLIDDCMNDARTQGRRDAAVLAMLFCCGLRRSEVVGIDVESLDPVEGSVVIRGKGYKKRLVYPPQRAWELINDWLRESGKTEGPLFCRIRKGGVITADRLTGQAVYFLINQFTARARMARFAPHDLRAAFISHLLDQGENIMTVADIVGHAAIQTTAAYGRRGVRRKKRVNRAIKL